MESISCASVIPSLHTRFCLSSRVVCSKSLFNDGLIPRMKTRHESMQRLLAIAAAAGVRGPSELSKALGESEQTVTNWSARGISKAGAIKAQSRFGCSPAWLIGVEEKALLPASPPPVASLNDALAALCTEDRERAATLLSSMARDPSGPWAGWLADLLADSAKRCLTDETANYTPKAAHRTDGTTDTGSTNAETPVPMTPSERQRLFNLGEFGDTTKVKPDDGHTVKRIQK